MYFAVPDYNNTRIPKRKKKKNQRKSIVDQFKKSTQEGVKGTQQGLLYSTLNTVVDWGAFKAICL